MMDESTRAAMPSEVVALILFGSEARGNSDSDSDRDICVFADVRSMTDAVRLRQMLAPPLRTEGGSVTIYRCDVAERMALSGSLFILHLKLEGRTLFDPTSFVPALYQKLRPYSNYCHDIRTYERVFAPIVESATSGSRLTLADLQGLFIVSRNISTIISMHLGTPAFGRRDAFIRARQAFSDLALSEASYDTLVQAHLRYLRGVGPRNDLPLAQERKLLREVEAFVQFGKELVGT